LLCMLKMLKTDCAEAANVTQSLGCIEGQNVLVVHIN